MPPHSSSTRRRATLTLTTGCLLGAAVAVAGTDYEFNSFSYQGRLMQSGAPFNGTRDIVVRFYSTPDQPFEAAIPVLFQDVPIQNGLFTIAIDHDTLLFNGSARYLEFEVRVPNQPSGITLSPRQEVQSAPYADYSYKTRGVDVALDNSFAGVGRSTPITGSERFGVHADTTGYGGMYVSTQLGGQPFYGYARGGLPEAWTYLAPASDDWRVSIDVKDVLSVGKTSGLKVFGLQGESSLELDPFGESIQFRQNLNGVASTMMGFNYFFGQPITYFPQFVGVNQDFAHVPLHVRSDSEATSIFDRHGSDGTVMVFSTNTNARGTISISGSTVSYNAFTGSHYAFSDEPLERGMLLSMDGRSRRLPGDGDDKGECIHGVRASQTANDPAVIGAYNGLLDPALAASDDNPLLAMAEGNGDIWVVDDGRGDLRPGDLLIASDVRGAAMLDDPQRFPQGNIVARVAESLEWSTVPLGADGVRRAKAAVLFDRFVRSADASALATEIDAQRKEIDALRAAVAKLLEARD